MKLLHEGLTRRDVLAGTGAGILTAGFGSLPALAATPLRQGYQTNM